MNWKLRSPKDAPTITNVKGKMEIVTDAEEKEAETILKLTLKTCPVGVIFENAKIKYDWTLTAKNLKSYSLRNSIT